MREEERREKKFLTNNLLLFLDTFCVSSGGKVHSSPAESPFRAIVYRQRDSECLRVTVCVCKCECVKRKRAKEKMPCRQIILHARMSHSLPCDLRASHYY